MRGEEPFRLRAYTPRKKWADERKTAEGKAPGTLLWSLKFLLPLLLLLLFCAEPKETLAATPYAANGRLSVSKGKVVNEKGKPFVIKGVSTHGLSWYPQYVNRGSFKTLRDQWGVNTIRLALYTAEYHGYCSGGNRQELKKVIDDGVKIATDLGMYVIIDWHILSDGNPLTYRSQAKSFFAETAGKYAGYGNVLYEICNEPNGSGGTWSNIKRYAETIIPAIRKVNKKAIIIVGTPTWSQDVDTAQKSPIAGQKNIVYAFHFYAGTHKEALRTRLKNVLKKNFPVLVSEYALSPASGSGPLNTAEGNRWMKLLDTFKVGRVCWNLSNKNESCSLLKNTCTKTGGFTASDLSDSGKWLVKTYTGKAAGSQTGGEDSPGGDLSDETGDSKNPENPEKPDDPDNPESGENESSRKKSKTSTGKVKVKATISLTSSWESGGQTYAQYQLLLANTGKVSSSKWSVKVTFAQTFKLSENWCGFFLKKNRTLTIRPLSWNGKLLKGETTQIGFILSGKKMPRIQTLSVSAS